MVCDIEAETLPIIYQGFCLKSSIGEKAGRKKGELWRKDRVVGQGAHSGTDCTSRPSGSKSSSGDKQMLYS